ncbi:MAG: methyl-accepting chemotaxis protein [Candidatus Desulfofervidus auxilii]|nr:methyl-accepting chemotaxis protein [Candidatus Desulfofervidus auxilii]
MQRRKRLNFSIKREFQLRLLFKVFIIVLISVISSLLIFYIISRQELGETYYQAHIRIKSFQELLLPVIIGGILVGSLVGFLVALFFPQPIAGPLYRIEKELKKVGEGDLTLNLRIRKNDELQDLVSVINEMIKNLNEKVKLLKLNCEKLNIALEKGDIDAARSASTELKETIAIFKVKN